jgi:hypothetical protein
MSMDASDFRAAAAKYLLQVDSESALIDAALITMRSDLDSPALVELATSAPGTLRREEFADLIQRSFEQLGLPALTQGELSDIRARAIAAEICSGDVDPIEGADRLWSGRSEYGDPSGDLAELIQLLDEWEVNLSARSAIAGQITRIACAMAAGAAVT